MQIAITGGSGFLGCRLARALLADPGVDSIVLADMVQAQAPGDDARLVFLRADLSQAGAAESVAEGADVIFHLAAVLSGQAEADFDLGMGVNIDATRRLLEAANLAQSQLALLVATNQWQSGNLSGDFSPNFPDYTWTPS